MERSLTYSNHSTTVTMRYFTQGPHKSYGPMTQLLPGPQCHTCPNHFTSNFSVSLHPSLSEASHTPPVPSSFSCTASLFLSASTPLLHLPVSCFSNPRVSVCPSAFLHVRLSPSYDAVYQPRCLSVAILPSCRSLVLCPPRSICSDWHPVSEPLRVLSASSCAEMDVWRVLQASLFVTSA